MCVHTTEEGGLYGLCSTWAVKRSLSRKEMQASASTPEEDFMTLCSAHSTSRMMKWRRKTCRTHRLARSSFWLGHQDSLR